MTAVSSPPALPTSKRIPVATPPDGPILRSVSSSMTGRAASSTNPSAADEEDVRDHDRVKVAIRRSRSIDADCRLR